MFIFCQGSNPTPSTEELKLRIQVDTDIALGFDKVIQRYTLQVYVIF